MPPFAVTYDYLCPFAKNIHLHLVAGLRAGADWDVTFVPWSLHQAHRDEGAPDVWDDPAYDDRLLALCASVSVRDNQPDLFLASHEALFVARHEAGRRLASREDVDEALAPLGVDLAAVHEDVASRRPHKLLGEAHRDYERYEAFGVPTFVLGDDASDGTFVRYMVAPSGDDAASIGVIDSIVSLMTLDPDLNEFKHTRVPA
ncbi:MAG: DsbA family protein [Acidimicrobiales bacterium]